MTSLQPLPHPATSRRVPPRLHHFLPSPSVRSDLQVLFLHLQHPADVHAAVYHTVIFYRSRHTDTDSLHIVPGDSLFCQLSLNRLSHIRQNRCSAVFLIRLDLPFVNELSIRLKNPILQVVPPTSTPNAYFFMLPFSCSLFVSLHRFLSVMYSADAFTHAYDNVSSLICQC